MVSMESSDPVDLVTTDVLKVHPCKCGTGNIFVITYNCTKFAITVPTANQTAKDTVDVLLNHFLCKYDILARLLSDQGLNFGSEVIEELCEVLNIENVRATVYHPQCSEVSERFNRSLLAMLGTLEPEKKM